MGEQPLPAVLVVSVFSPVSRSVRRALARRGLAVIHAASPAGGLTLFQAHRPQIRLALIDMLTPTAGYLELAAELERLRPGLPALYLFGAQKTIARCSIEAEDPCSVLEAPFAEDQLIARIDSLIDSQTAARPMSDERLWDRLIATSDRISSGTAVLCLYRTHQAGLAAGHAAALRAGGILHSFRPTNCEAAPYGTVVRAPDMERARSLTAPVRAAAATATPDSNSIYFAAENYYG